MAIRGFTVYLDDEDEDDLPVIELLDKKAARRRASTYIRDALLAYIRGMVPTAIPVAASVSHPSAVPAPVRAAAPVAASGDDVVSKARRAFLK